MALRRMAAVAAILFASSAAHAGVAQELIAAINQCAAITEDGARHACYDRLPALVKSFEPAAAAETSAAAQPKAPPDEKSLLTIDSDLFASEPVPADHISARVESYTFDYGVFVVTLDNGQVWRQVAAIGDLIHFSKDKKDEVTIWRSSFGYVMKIEGFHTKYHVKRIR